MKQILILVLCCICNYIPVFSQIDTTFYQGQISIELTNTNYLIVKHNILTMSEEEVSRFTRLSLSGDFNQIPDFIFRFTGIEEMEINSLRKVSMSVGFNKLNNLHSLRFFSVIEKISDSIKLDKLELFEAKSTEFKRFPNAVLQWKNLIELNLQNGNYYSIPEAITTLHKMKVLNLSNNNIREVPQNIGEFCNLEVLSLCNNKIRKLPDSICNSKKLKELYISGNPIFKLIKKNTLCPKLSLIYR